MEIETKTVLTNEELTQKIHELQIALRELDAQVNEMRLEFHGYGG